MRKLTRNEKVALGVGGVLIAVIIWLLLRRGRASGGNIQIGPLTVGGYSPGSTTVSIPPDLYNFVLSFQPPLGGVMAGGGESPCACGCDSATVNFLDLSSYAQALQDNLDAQTIAGVQRYFSMNPELYAFSNDNKIGLFIEGYEGAAKIRATGNLATV